MKKFTQADLNEWMQIFKQTMPKKSVRVTLNTSCRNKKMSRDARKEPYSQYQ